MKKWTWIVLLIILIKPIAFAQPGPYGGTLAFKVFYKGNIVDLNATGWAVTPAIGDTFFKSITYTFPGYYTIIPNKGNGGSMLPANFHIQIVHFKDTMNVYLPSINYQTVKIENVPFAKGVYHIPQHIYNVKQITDEDKAYTFIPAINGDWSLFKKESYVCYLEKVQAIETNYPYYDYGHSLLKLEQMYRMDFPYKGPKSGCYYFGNVIISTLDAKNHNIYVVREISDTTFWGSKIADSKICFLYAQNHEIYAIASRTFSGPTTGVITEYGIFKLHFYDEPINNVEREHLQIQLNEGTYRSLLKVDTTQYDNVNLIPKITSKYNKLKHEQ